jgi:hypothetical protein
MWNEQIICAWAYPRFEKESGNIVPEATFPHKHLLALF